MDQTVKFFKLVSGENIIGSTATNCEELNNVEVYEIDNPVLVNAVRFPRGNMVYETFVMQPFIALSSQTNINVLSKHVVFTTDVKDTVREQYFDYLNTKNESSISSSTYEDMDENDEAILDFLKEELEEEYHGGEEDEKPTFH